MPRKEHSYHFIYKTTNLITNKYYIGMHSTSNLNDGYLGSGDRLRRSVKKYGKENFKFEILEFLPDRNTLKQREKDLVNEDMLKDVMCMNLQPGGGGGFIDENHIKKVRKGASDYLKNKWKDEEYRKKISSVLLNNVRENHKKGSFKYDTFKGKKHSEETKEKMRKPKNIGETNSQFGTMWITNGIESRKIKNTGDIPQGWYKGRKLN